MFLKFYFLYYHQWENLHKIYERILFLIFTLWFQVFLMAIVVQINWIMEFWQLVMELLKVEKITGWSKILGVKNGDVMDISNLPEIRTTNVELQLWLPILKFKCVFLFLKMWFLLLFISIHELFIDFLKNFWQIINLNN